MTFFGTSSWTLILLPIFRSTIEKCEHFIGEMNVGRERERKSHAQRLKMIGKRYA